MDPEVLVEQGQWKEASAVDCKGLSLGITKQVDLASAAADDRVIRQCLDAWTERADQADEASADQYRLRRTDHALVYGCPLRRSERSLFALEVVGHRC